MRKRGEGRLKVANQYISRDRIIRGITIAHDIITYANIFPTYLLGAFCILSKLLYAMRKANDCRGNTNNKTKASIR